MCGECNTINGLKFYCTRLPECPAGDRIIVYSKIEHNTNFNYTVTDKFGHEYTKTIQTDTDGNFFLMLEDFPKQLFTQHSGLFILTIKKDNESCENTAFAFCDLVDGEVVKHVQFSFYKVNTSTEAIIGCDCE